MTTELKNYSKPSWAQNSSWINWIASIYEAETVSYTLQTTTPRYIFTLQRDLVDNKFIYTLSITKWFENDKRTEIRLNVVSAEAARLFVKQFELTVK